MGLRTTILVNNMSSGELSPELLGRVDLAKYQNGCETLVNWLPLIEGGMQSRAGTRFVQAAKFPGQTARLWPFIFSTLQAYMLEFGDGYIRFYKDGGQIVEDTPEAAIVEIGTPYGESDLPRLKFRQDADTLYIAHPGYATKKLTRTSHTAWTLEDVSFLEGPFLDQNADETKLITASGGQLVINGVFTTDATGWTDEDSGGTFTVSAGKANLAHGAGAGDQSATQTAIPTVPGSVYTVTFDVGAFDIKASAGSAPLGVDLFPLTTFTPGSRSYTFTATGTTAYLYFESATTGSTSTLDNVSCIKPLHTGAAVILTSSVDLFFPGHVGAIWKIADATGSPAHDAWEAGATITDLGTRRVSNGRVYETTTTGANGTRPPVHLRGLVSDGNNTWAFINDGAGYVEITGYSGPREVAGIVKQHLPQNAASGTSYWAEGVFSGVQGYPRAVAFVEQRMALAGMLNNPSRIDLSETGNYEGFKQGTLADQAVSLVVASGEVNTILWMEKGVVWFVGTNGVVYALTTSNDTPITPDNLPNVKEIFSYGSADIQPLKIGGNLLFVQRGGKRVREINYEAGVNNDVRSDRTVLARHITNNQAVITAWSYEQDPNSTVWAVRSDGVLLAITYFPEQDVIAWSRHVTAGFFESVATIPTTTSDQTWVIVKRVINGEEVRYVEYFDEAVNTDCALTYAGLPIDTLSAASVAHLRGKEVQILASGAKEPSVTVGSSDLTFAREHATYEVGLQFDSDCLTVRPEIRTSAGSSQGIKGRMPDLVARVVRTPTLRVNDQTYATRDTRDYMDTGPPYVTGDIPFKTLGHTTTKQIRIQRTEPFPAKVIGVYAVVDLGEK